MIYGLIVSSRNLLFNKNVFKPVVFDLPVIGVGNLSVGGTGKSPMVEYLVSLLTREYQVATLSRGYKRRTKGYLMAGPQTTAIEIGDEPMQFHQKFPQIAVAVGEDRTIAIPRLLQDRPGTEVVILDDSFQHRWVKPGLEILLTQYGRLFSDDFFLPAGHLRDQRASAKRADLIVVTKCPSQLQDNEMQRIQNEISTAGQPVFFTCIQYGQPYHFITGRQRTLSVHDNVLVVSGIAHPAGLKEYLVPVVKSCHEQAYADHHNYTDADVELIKKRFDQLPAEQKILLTTEKDAARLQKFKTTLSALPLYVLPVQHQFLQGRGIQFDNIVKTYIESFEQKHRHE